MSREPETRIQRFTANRFAVGMVGMVIAAILVYLIFSKDIPFTNGYRVNAVFTSSNQLIKGSPVRIAGVNVGKVVGLDRGPGDRAKVTMEIKKEGLPLHKDATMKIRPRLFLEGGFFVAVEPGSPSSPVLKDGSTLPVSQTAVPVQFHQILTALNRPVRDSLKSTLKELGTALDGGGAQAFGRASLPAARALSDVAVISDAARGSHTHDVSELVSGASRITSAIARRQGELAGLVTDLRRTAGTLAAHDTALASSVRQLDGTLREAPDAFDAIDRTLPPVRGLALDLRPGLKALPSILRNAVALLTQVRGLNHQAELPRLLDYLEPTVTNLPVLEQRLDSLLTIVTPVTDCVRDRAVPVLNTKLQDGSLSTNRPVWQDLVHSTVGLNSAAQSFDANGPWVRFGIGGGEYSIATVGTLPGIGQLVGRFPNVVLGARPAWLGPGAVPPLAPHALCRDQAAPKLQTPGTVAGGGLRSVRAPAKGPKITKAGLQKLLRDAKVKLPAVGRKAGR